MKSPPIPFMAILEQLSKAKSDKQIDKIITKAWDSDSQEFFLGLQLSIDDTVDFKVHKAPEYETSEDDGTNAFTFDDFYNLVLKITQSKNISIEEIKDLIREAAGKCNPKDWNLFYRKIILKKLHKDLKMSAIIKSLNRLTNPQGNANLTHKTAKQTSDASVILSRKN